MVGSSGDLLFYMSWISKLNLNRQPSMIDKQCSQLHGMGVVILCLLNIILGEKFTFNYTYITMSQKCKYAPGQEGGLTLEGGCIHLSGHLLLSNSNR